MTQKTWLQCKASEQIDDMQRAWSYWYAIGEGLRDDVFAVYTLHPEPQIEVGEEAVILVTGRLKSRPMSMSPGDQREFRVRVRRLT